MAKKTKNGSKQNANPFTDLLKGKSVAIVGKLKDSDGDGMRRSCFEDYVKAQKGTIRKKVTASLDILIAAKASLPEVKLAKKLNGAGEANIEISIDDYSPLLPGIRECLVDHLTNPVLAKKFARFLWDNKFLVHPSSLVVEKVKFEDEQIGKIKSSKAEPEAFTQIGFDACKFNQMIFGCVDFESHCFFKKCEFHKSKFSGFGLVPHDCLFKDCNGDWLSIYNPQNSRFEKLTIGNFSLRYTYPWVVYKNGGQAVVTNCEFKSCQLGALEIGAITDHVVIRKSKFQNCLIEKLRSHDISKTTAEFRFEDCNITGTDFMGGKLQDFQLAKCKVSKSSFDGLDFEFMSVPKSEFNQVKFGNLKGGMLDLRGGKFKSCSISDCEIGVIMVDDKQRSQIKGLDDCNAIMDFSALEHTKQLAAAIKQSSKFSLNFNATSKAKKKQFDRFSIDKNKLVSFSRTVETKGKDWYGRPGQIYKPFTQELKTSASADEYVASLAWLIRSRPIHELISSSIDFKATKCQIKKTEIEACLVNCISEIQNSNKAKVEIKTRANAPSLASYESFTRYVSRTFDPQRIVAALESFHKEPIEISYRLKDGELSAVFVPDSKKKRTYLCTWKPRSVYHCCTNSLANCGGLRGAPCKHLLMIIIALAKYKNLAAELDELLEGFKKQKPTPDRDLAADLFSFHEKGRGCKKLTTKPSDFPKKQSANPNYWQY